MGDGYIRQAAADIVDGADVEAAPLNLEFNAMQAFAHGTTGHSHDGTTGEGPKINLATSISGILPVANGGLGGINKTNATTAPTVGDDTADGYVVGSLWIDTTADKVYVATDVTLGAAVWLLVGQVGSWQPLDSDLTAIAALTTTATGRSLLAAANAAAIRAIASAQAEDATLTALAAYNTNGILTQTAADTFAGRTITGTADEIEVTNGNGVSGNPTIGLPDVVAITTRLEPATNDAVPLGSTTKQWRTLFIAAGYGIDFDGGNATIDFDGTNINFNGANYFFEGIIDTANTGQIKFPASQNASTNANTLDDYEEGTFTPVLVASGSTFNYALQEGYYVKVGGVLHGWFRVGLNTSGNTLTASNLTITGMPTVKNAGPQLLIFPLYWANSTSSFIFLNASTGPGGTSFAVRGATAASTTSVSLGTANTVLHATNASVLYCTFSYPVD